MDWTTIALFPVAAAWLVLFVVALRSIFRSPDLTDTNRLLWIAVVLIAPVLGPLLWFVMRRSQERSSR